jgi:protein TonB
MAAEERTFRDRIRAGIPVLIIHALLALALLRSLVLEIPPLPAPMLQLIDVPPSLPPPVPPVRPVRERSRRPEGASAPPNLESRPTEIVAPPRVVPQPAPPVVAAPVAGPGDKASAGAAPGPGPGTGAGGQGNGTGNGGYGDGPGGGGDDGGDTPPRHIRGAISDRDYPHGAAERGIGGTVSVIYAIETNGRATHCRITHSSGNAELDETTCRLIEERFRYEPRRDRWGRPLLSHMESDHEWVVEDIPPPRDEPPERPRRRFGF